MAFTHTRYKCFRHTRFIPKDNAEWLNWITQGKLLYADKEKIQTLIDQQRRTLAEVDYLDLNSFAKIIKGFANPSIDGKLKGKPVSIGRITKEGKEYLENLSGMKMKDVVDFVLNPSNMLHISMTTLATMKRTKETMFH